MNALIDLTGRRVGRLTVVRYDGRGKLSQNMWFCVCDCGGSKSVRSSSLQKGACISCGCAQKKRVERTRMSMPEYRIWRGIINRCENPNVRGFPLYGGRGVKMCPEWRESFDAFLGDMGSRPTPAHSVERLDPNGDYSPTNCRWATDLEQANNKRNTRFVVYRGERMSLCNAVRLAGSVVHHEAAWVRVADCGWDVATAVETPRLFESPNSNARKRYR